MKEENLKILYGISQDIANKMATFQSEDKYVVILPRSFVDTWQRELFKIVADELKEDNH